MKYSIKRNKGDYEILKERGSRAWFTYRHVELTHSWVVAPLDVAMASFCPLSLVVDPQPWIFVAKTETNPYKMWGESGAPWSRLLLRRGLPRDVKPLPHPDGRILANRTQFPGCSLVRALPCLPLVVSRLVLPWLMSEAYPWRRRWWQ